MSDPYLGEIRLFAGDYAPQDWSFCNGQTMSVGEYQALYSLIGTTYGGDGVSSFALPNLAGRVIIGVGKSSASGKTHALASSGGEDYVTLNPSNLPAHTHIASASNKLGSLSAPAANTWAVSTIHQYSTTVAQAISMASSAVSTVGDGVPHPNVMPSIALNYIIAMVGLYPSPA